MIRNLNSKLLLLLEKSTRINLADKLNEQY